MNDIVRVCGTGDWNGPKPGDPDNNVSLNAKTVFGGIYVSWSCPAINPHAVAHVMLYRGDSADFNLALQREVVAGSHFLDLFEATTPTQYFYWIKIVSVNGTIAEPIGPVSATVYPRSSQLLDDLRDLISVELMNNILKAEIAAISLLRADISIEITNRLADNQALQDILAQVDAANGETLGFLNQEITTRTDADNALVQVIDTMAASVDGNLAAIIEERTVRASEDEVLANRITTTYGELGDSLAVVIEDVGVLVTDTTAMAEDITLLTARVGDVEGSAISFEQFAQVTADVEGLHGQWAIKMQTDDPLNPVIAGIALAVEDPVAGPGASSLVFMADKFAFHTLNGAITPFTILGNQVEMEANVRIGGLLVLGPDGLNPDFAASGTLNSDITPLITDAQNTADAASGIASDAALAASNAASDAADALTAAGNASQAASAAVTAANSKLSKAGNDAVTGTIRLQSSEALLVGTSNDGIYFGSSGLVGRMAGQTTFHISADGSALFKGNVQSIYGTVGTIGVAPGGSISSGVTNGRYFSVGDDGTVTIRSASGGSRTEISHNKIQIFSNNALRVRLGSLLD